LIINGFQSHFFGGDGNGTQKSWLPIMSLYNHLLLYHLWT
jgi:hypothetical protein